VGCAALSIAGFLARGVLMLKDSPLLGQRLVRVVPHIVDTLLLASALWLIWFLGASPLEQPWLAAKIAALFAYIGFGMVALRRGRSKGVRAAAFAAALVAALYIVAVAFSRDARGPLALLGA
jgi:uncharacterized membrane protein SirB2